MNNVKYWNDSLAHDFDMFMPKPKKTVADNVIPIPEVKRNVKKAEKTATSTKAKIFMAVAIFFIVGAFFGNIYLHAEISKVSAELGHFEAQSEELKSERTRLQVELERKTSVGNLEQQATKLGMQKQEKSQMNYIFTYNDKDDCLGASK